MFQFENTSGIIHVLDIWYDSVDGGADLREASTCIGQHNTEQDLKYVLFGVQ
jgi:hypothetical protein